MKYLRIPVLIMAIVMALSFCGCGEDKEENTADAQKTESTEEQTYAVGTYERKAADSAASGEADPDAEVISFGSKSIFKGIQIETDENGEIVCTESEGELQYRIKDKRFNSYYSLKQFVKKKSGAKAMNQYSPYFGERDGTLYFIIGANNRGIRDYSQYYVDGSKKLTVDIIHTEESRKKHSVARSQINFVKNKKGEWKLNSLTVWKE